jgi:hypothetical protein
MGAERVKVDKILEDMVIIVYCLDGASLGN